MKYGDLVSFEPVVGVKVLGEADDHDRALDDTRTYVISERMAERLRDVVLPGLRFDTPGEKKCVLVVATYGTGKTHLMSVISAVAEHADLRAELTDETVATAAAPIAGKFQVIRHEIGATKMTLRDIIAHVLESGLAGMGVTFSFQAADQVTNTKDSIVAMMEAFESKFPDQGLLLVIDELLDFLRGRRDNELAFDLTVLREIGEIARSTRFRFIAGIQETLFDNPRFASAADAVQRVKDRFDQVRIDRADVAFVVKQRLLRKSVTQRDAIRKHLVRFTPAFAGMAEELDEYIDLFPVHPSYLRAFEAMTIVEKRKVLETLSEEMMRRVDEEVPTDLPGLITYDSYRSRLEADPANRAIESVREVLDKGETLRRIAHRSIPNRDDIGPALRVIDALAISRLTTGDDIHVEVGPTAAMLRDDLSLMLPGMPTEALFLETWVETVVTEIVKAVSGQFITQNQANGQVYLDVRKDIDYDQKVEDRAASLDDAALDRAYFGALEQVLEVRDVQYVSGYNIWEYNLAWSGHGIGRLGYMFFGAPDERSTAQPPRDYYLYFLQPYERREIGDRRELDEVFFRLEHHDDDFTGALRRHAGATALGNETAVPTHRAVYRTKAQRALDDMIAWLRTNMGEAVSVIYDGDVKTVAEWASTAGPQPRDVIKDIASRSLSPFFDSRYPGYPKFSSEITLGPSSNLAETVRQTVAAIATGRKSALADKVLLGLQLTNSKGEIVDSGEYAARMLADLAAAGRPLTRKDLLTPLDDPGVLVWGPWNLELWWMATIAAAMCHMGRVEIGYPGQQIDAITIDRLTRMDLNELQGIAHIAPPKPAPMVILRDTIALVGIGPAQIPSTGVTPELVTTILVASQELRKRVADARDRIATGIEVWGAEVVDQKPERLGRLDGIQGIADDLRGRDSVGKVNKIATTPQAIEGGKQGLEELAWIEATAEAQGHIAAVVTYLREARGVFGDKDPIRAETEDLHERILEAFSPAALPDVAVISDLRKEAEALRGRYIDEAARAHGRSRLDRAGDDRKVAIRVGPVYEDLNSLADITLLPRSVFGDLQVELTEIGTCPDFDENDLQQSVICLQCGYRPIGGSGPSASEHLSEVETSLNALREQWEKVLADNLSVEGMAERVQMLDDPVGQASVANLLSTKSLPTPIDRVFVNAVNEMLAGFEVREATREQFWAALFPAQAPASLTDLRDRFDSLLSGIRGDADEDKVRVVPGEEESE